MYREITKAIVRRYKQLNYNNTLLNTTCPIRADITALKSERNDPEKYPCAVYFIVNSENSPLSTCDDMVDTLFQINVFDNNTDDTVITGIADVIKNGFNNCTLTQLDGNQFSCLFTGARRVYVPQEYGWQWSLDFMLKITKERL